MVTNFEWLNSLTLEEHAEWIEHKKTCSMCVYRNKTTCSGIRCVDGIKEWLKMEHCEISKEVVMCKDCIYWYKQENSAQGRCVLSQMYPTGSWYCADGKRKDEE